MKLDPDVWTPSELAKYLKVCEDTLLNWRRRGEGPRFFRVGNRIRYPRKEVMAWIDGKTGRGRDALAI